MVKSTPLGLIAGFGLIFGAIFLGTGWQTFFDPASLLLVGGGTAAALFVNYSFADLSRVPGGTRDIFAFTPPSIGEYVELLSDLSGIARREGLLALDRRIDELDNDLLRFGLERAVDGMDENEIQEMLDQRIAEKVRREQVVPNFFMTAGTYAPAFGMVGTLIGLIQMLQNLDDPTQIGAGMATAMVTTFYGALLANLVFLPLSEKAKAQKQLNRKARYVVREGILAIARGDSPRMIEQRLQFFATDEAGGEAADATDTSDAAETQAAPAMA
jgi:chemotaxis protein MotA